MLVDIVPTTFYLLLEPRCAERWLLPDGPIAFAENDQLVAWEVEFFYGLADDFF